MPIIVGSCRGLSEGCLMDLAMPLAVVTPTLDAAVLHALAATTARALDGILRGPPRHLTTQLVHRGPRGRPADCSDLARRRASPGSPWGPGRARTVIAPRNYPTEPVIYIR